MLPTKDPFAGGGWSLFIAGALLTVISILLIYSANYNSPDPELKDYYLKQSLWFFTGMVAFFLTVAIPFRFHEAFAHIYYATAVVLLLGLIGFGSSRLGAQRWYALGFFNFQPSELAKIAVVMAMARYLTYSRRPIHGLRKIVTAGVIAGFPTLIVLKQPDLGTAVIFLVGFIAMMFWAGLPVRYLLLFITPAISMIASTAALSWIIFFVLLFIALYLIRPSFYFGALVIFVNVAFGAISTIAWNHLHDYQRVRIKIFLDPGQDPLGAGYQIIQSKVAIGSGGLIGKGFLAGSQSQLDFLPLRHTDFIFSIAGEEFGLLGALVILGLFSYILYRGLRGAMKARNNFVSLLSLGVTSILAFQMFVNVGMSLGLLPVTGVPLPFVSYGGSSMLTSWILLGILVNVERNWQEY